MFSNVIQQGSGPGGRRRGLIWQSSDTGSRKKRVIYKDFFRYHGAYLMIPYGCQEWELNPNPPVIFDYYYDAEKEAFQAVYLKNDYWTEESFPYFTNFYIKPCVYEYWRDRNLYEYMWVYNYWNDVSHMWQNGEWNWDETEFIPEWRLCGASPRPGLGIPLETMNASDVLVNESWGTDVRYQYFLQGRGVFNIPLWTGKTTGTDYDAGLVFKQGTAKIYKADIERTFQSSPGYKFRNSYALVYDDATILI